MDIREINEKLCHQYILLPCDKLQWIDLPSMHTLGITCRKGWVTIRHDLGMLLDNKYILLIDPEHQWIVSYGRFIGVRATLEAPKLEKAYTIQVLDSFHPLRKRKRSGAIAPLQEPLSL
jgi:hypothetical protein